MTPEQFCYWLQGYAELHQQTPTTIQWVAIMQHLDTVFKKVTPPVPNPLTQPPVNYDKAIKEAGKNWPGIFPPLSLGEITC